MKPVKRLWWPFKKEVSKATSHRPLDHRDQEVGQMRIFGRWTRQKAVMASAERSKQSDPSPPSTPLRRGSIVETSNCWTNTMSIVLSLSGTWISPKKFRDLRRVIKGRRFHEFEDKPKVREKSKLKAAGVISTLDVTRLVRTLATCNAVTKRTDIGPRLWVSSAFFLLRWPHFFFDPCFCQNHCIAHNPVPETWVTAVTTRTSVLMSLCICWLFIVSSHLFIV